LPLDAAGMTGCVLLVEPAVMISTVTSSTGDASLPLTIPGTPGLSAKPISFQWLHRDPAGTNPTPLFTTGGRLVQVGPVLCANRYVYDLFDENAATGSLQAGGPVVFLSTVP
jgi:hypothetical protein